MVQKRYTVNVRLMKCSSARIKFSASEEKNKITFEFPSVINKA